MDSSASAFAAGIGAIFHRRPFLVTLGWLLAAENLLAWVPSVAQVSILYHARVVAGLPTESWSRATPASSIVIGLLVAGAWLAAGAAWIRRAEYAAAE